MFVAEALESHKHVFVEKPLSTTWDGRARCRGLGQFEGLGDGGIQPTPLAVELKSTCLPQMNVVAMNAGYIPPEVWVHDLKQVEGASSVKRATSSPVHLFAGSEVEKFA